MAEPRDTESPREPESPPAADAPPRAKRSQRTALTVVGLIAAVVIGFVLGFIARIPLEDKQPPAPTGDSVDVGFAQDMTVHHNQAIEMAAIALTNASDPAVKNLAYDILTTQQNQVGQMQGWLSLWGQPLLPTGGYMGWMTESDGHSHAHGASAADGHGEPMAKMPGMATSEDMAALRQATGPAVDVLFLQLMLRHHEGGLPMMQYGAQHASVATVRNLAQTMVDTQQSESQLMTTMLAQRGAAPLPMN